MSNLKNLNFHQTFPPTKDFISRLFSICALDMPLNKEEISNRTGIPTGKSSGKVAPHISYAVYMGILEDTKKEGKHHLMLTPLGQEIQLQDPGMQEVVTLLLCHAHLASSFGGATLWAHLFKQILPKYPNGVSAIALQDELDKLSTTPVKTGPFFSSYSDMFAPLQLLTQDSKSIRLSKAMLDEEALYVYAYALFYEWEQTFPAQAEITAAELPALKIAETFGWSDETLYQLLELLAEKGILRFNRQLAPFTILKMHTANDMIPHLYSLLC
ncbi:hypothetical protein RFF05_12675 [Bengtsoniella intestinalis]|uniref:hypothetical protein n=1 Tax=Bengtsoniella intestinalis TaxID=3073143 RepID=UPI00391FBB49